MNELLPLFPVLFLVYALQCISSAPPASEVFIVAASLRGRRLRHAFRVGRSQNQLFLHNPFRPSVGAIIADRPPFTIRRDTGGEFLGIEGSHGSFENLPRRLCSFEVPHKFSAEETKVLVDGAEFLLARTEETAKEIVALLGQVQSAPVDGRLELINRYFSKWFTLETVDKRLEEYSRNAEILHIACSYLFFFLFFLAPTVVFFRGLQRVWPILLVYLVLSSWLILWLYRRSLRMLYPSRKWQNLPQLIGFALWAFAAIRANDSLLADLLIGFHPIAVAYRLLAKQEFLEFAGSEVRKTKYLFPDSELLQSLSEFLRKVEIDVASFLAPPIPETSHSRSFCPICLTQYVIDAGFCMDCGQIALRPFSKGGGKTIESKMTPHL